MEKELKDKGIEIPELNWKEFQQFYKDNIVEKPVDTRTKLEIQRSELFPQIVKLMKQLKGRTNATRDEIDLMFSLYNRFYIRHDNPNCGVCVGRVWSNFKKICKGRI